MNEWNFIGVVSGNELKPIVKKAKKLPEKHFINMDTFTVFNGKTLVNK